MLDNLDESPYDYAVIVPAWNEEHYLSTTLQSINNAMSAVPASGQLIVVNNNSTDNTAKVAQKNGATVVFEAKNQISRARNTGACAANAAAYIFIDADSTLSPELLLSTLEALDRVDVVGGGALVAPDQPPSLIVGLFIALWNCNSRLFKLAAGCFVFVKADAFHDVGGFTLERYAGEELVLSRDLSKWGKQHTMRFHIITEHRITTSLRKAEWYTAGQLVRQALRVLIPGSLNSKHRMHTWYDEKTKRTRK